MNDWLVAPVAGGILLVIGLTLLRAHYRNWQVLRQNSELEELDRRHFHARYRRRMQTSGLLALLGLLLPIGDAFIPANAPGVFGIYWIAVLLLTFWVVVLGLGDMISTTVYSKASMARIRRKQRELEQQLELIRKSDADPEHHRWN